MVKKRTPKAAASGVVSGLPTLVEELKVAEEEIVVELEKDVPEKKKESDDIAKKREELLKLAGDKEIVQTVAAVKRASGKVVERIYSEWEEKCKGKAAAFLCDQFLSKFCAVLGGFDAIENPEEMEKELRHDPLLRKDVENVMVTLAPWIPFLGMLSGGLTVGKHVFNHKGGKMVDGFARGPFGGEKPPSERTEEEVKDGYDTVN